MEWKPSRKEDEEKEKEQEQGARGVVALALEVTRVLFWRPVRALWNDKSKEKCSKPRIPRGEGEEEERGGGGCEEACEMFEECDEGKV